MTVSWFKLYNDVNCRLHAIAFKRQRPTKKRADLISAPLWCQFVTCYSCSRPLCGCWTQPAQLREKWLLVRNHRFPNQNSAVFRHISLRMVFTHVPNTFTGFKWHSHSYTIVRLTPMAHWGVVWSHGVPVDVDTRKGKLFFPPGEPRLLGCAPWQATVPLTAR